MKTKGFEPFFKRQNLKSVFKTTFPAFLEFILITKFLKLSGKAKENIQTCFNETFVIENFFDDHFQRYVEAKNKLSNRLNKAFLLSCKFLSDQVEIIFW